jgi:IS605 OrfB family transposase
MEKAYRYRFYPTVEQESLLRRTMGCARLVYNKALAARTEAWYEHQERVGYSQTSSMLTSWKQESDLEFLNEVSCVPLQQGLRHLQTAFTNFFAGRAKYPNFKKKHNGGSAEFTKSAFRWRDGQVFLAKCTEALPIRWSREIPEGCTPSTITVKLTTQLVRENQTIVVEDLAIKNMVKNHKLALAISDASWGELIRQLAYKCEWYGRELIKIDRWFPSSKRCGNCGHIVDKLPLNIRAWECPKCGMNHDRDINAANNILAAGLAVSVCGATVRPEESKSRKAGALKQKPK